MLVTRIKQIEVDLPPGGKAFNSKGEALDRRSALVTLCAQGWMVALNGTPPGGARIDGPGSYFSFSTPDHAIAELEAWVEAGMPDIAWPKTLKYTRAR